MDNEQSLPERARRFAAAAAASVAQVVVAVVFLYMSPHYWKQPYHTSKLTGQEWVNELKSGHPDRIHTELGMHLHVFLIFVEQLRALGLEDMQEHVSLEEQAAIFLYTCVTGLSLRHVGERFQHSTTTISKYFKKVLVALASDPFYSAYVILPTAEDPVADYITSKPGKLWPYFADVIGAMDGTQINCNPPSEELDAARNRKGGVTQNCLACTSFDMRFQYMLGGWEGSACDTTLYTNARFNDLRVPHGKYYLADAGFGFCDFLITPYTGCRYHLAEWGRADVRPVTKEELFNLRHAQARNVVERIFGVVKRRWRIMTAPPEINMKFQAMLPAALAALHNFILRYDFTEMEEVTEQIVASSTAYLDRQPLSPEQFGELAVSVPGRAERRRVKRKRDEIAQAMWDDYQTFLAENPQYLEG